MSSSIENGSTTSDILFSGDMRNYGSERDEVAQQESEAIQPIQPTTPKLPVGEEVKQKHRVQISEPSSSNAQNKAPRNDSNQGIIRMRGNVLIQNPSLEWKVRSCELNGSFLTFFRKQKMVAAIDLEQVGDINVLRKIKDSHGQGYIFSLHLKEGRYFQVRVTMHEDAANWVGVLTDVRDRLRAHQSFRSKSFSVNNDAQSSYTPTTTDFNTSVQADEPDDSIKLYFDKEQYPPSPILQSNEKYIRPIQTKVPESVLPVSQLQRPASSSVASAAPVKHRSGIPVPVPVSTPVVPASPKRIPALNTLLGGSHPVIDEEAVAAAEARKSVDTSPWRVPFDEIKDKLGPSTSPTSASNNSSGSGIPRPFTSLEGDFPAVGGRGPLGQSSQTLIGDHRYSEEVAVSGNGSPGSSRAAVSAAALFSNDLVGVDQVEEEVLRARYESPERAARERRMEAEREKRALAEKEAAAKQAEEEKQRAQKAVREAKEAAERAEWEKKLLQQRREKEARIAAEKVAEEERLAAEKASKEAWMASERAAREKKMHEEKAARARIAAEKAAEEEKLRAAKAAEEEKAARERAARVAEREAIARRKHTEAMSANRKVDDEEKGGMSEAEMRKVQRRVAAIERAVGLQKSPTSQAGSSRKESRDGGSSEKDYSVSDSMTNLLSGVDGVTMVDSPRSSFSNPYYSPTNRTSPNRAPGSITSTGSNKATPSGNATTPGLRFPLRRVSVPPVDPKISFYNADGSFKHVQNSPVKIVSPVKTSQSPDRAGSASKQYNTDTKNHTNSNNSTNNYNNNSSSSSYTASRSADRSRDRGRRESEGSVQFMPLTTKNIETHNSSASSPSLSVFDPATQDMVSNSAKDSGAPRGSLDIDNTKSSTIQRDAAQYNTSYVARDSESRDTPPRSHQHHEQQQDSSQVSNPVGSLLKNTPPRISTENPTPIEPSAADVADPASMSVLSQSQHQDPVHHSSDAGRDSFSEDIVTTAPPRVSSRSPPSPYKSPISRNVPTSPNKRSVAGRAAAASASASSRYSTIFIFSTVVVAVALLVSALLGGMHYYNRYLAEEQWRNESLRHLQAINQNFRSAEDLSSPTPGSIGDAPGWTTSPAGAATGGARPSASSTRPSGAGASPSGNSPRQTAPSGRATSAKAPTSAQGGQSFVKDLVAPDPNNALVRPNNVVKRLVRDLIRASKRFIANIFNKLARIFKS